MLADIYISRAMVQREHVDLHRHATFSCTIDRVIARIGAMFSRKA